MKFYADHKRQKIVVDHSNEPVPVGCESLSASVARRWTATDSRIAGAKGWSWEVKE